MQTIYSISLNGENFQALPQKALFWIGEQALLISDLHLGRAAHLRKSGFALTDMVHEKDMAKLAAVATQKEAKTIYILGDLFHSRSKGDTTVLETIIKDSKANWILVKGNHDVFTDEYYLSIGFQKVVSRILVRNKVLLIHEPDNKDLKSYLCISGHVHPGFRIKGRAKQSLKLPCFYIKKSQIILPALGETTGLFTVNLKGPQEWVIVCYKQMLKSISKVI